VPTYENYKVSCLERKFVPVTSITQCKVMESICVPEVVVGKTSGLRDCSPQVPDYQDFWIIR